MRYLYHATLPTRVQQILSKGIRSDGLSQRGTPPQAGVSTASNLSAVSKGDFGNAVLVIDRNKLRGFDLSSVDYWGDDRESEIRVIDPNKDVTVIPPSAIKELIYLTNRLAPFEIKHLSKLGLPISTYWKGDKKEVVGNTMNKAATTRHTGALTRIDPALVKGLRAWVKKVFSLKKRYSSLEDLFDHLNTLYKKDLNRFWEYLFYTKGFLPRGGLYKKSLLENISQKINSDLQDARDVFENELVLIHSTIEAMTPGTHGYEMGLRSGYSALTYYRSIDPDDPFRAALAARLESAEDALKKVEGILSGRVLRTITSFMNKYMEGQGWVQDEVLLEYNIGNVKLVYDGAPRDNQQEAANPRYLSDYIPYFRKAKALLDKRGFGDLWYGPIFIGCPGCGGENRLGKKFGVGAHYVIGKDHIVVFLEPKRYIVELLIHELGHRYYYKVMTREDRLRFDSFFKEVMAVSEYGSTATYEDFAEVFAHYVLGRDLTRDQLERFKAFLAGKDRGRVASKARTDEEKDEIFKKWKDLINMTPAELKAWAKNDDRLEASLSRDEADGIQSGYDSLHRIKRRINKSKEKWTDEDYDNASQENGFNQRMLGNDPGDPVGDTGMSKWEISLRNWGHDPSKKSSPAHSKWKAWKGRNKEASMQIEKPVRSRINDRLIREGFDGNKMFRKPGSAWASLFQILGDFGFTSDELPSFIGKSGYKRLSFRRDSVDYEGTEIDNSTIYFTWHQMPSGNYEVVAYLS